jgi:hypothetical protein
MRLLASDSDEVGSVCVLCAIQLIQLQTKNSEYSRAMAKYARWCNLAIFEIVIDFFKTTG